MYKYYTKITRFSKYENPISCYHTLWWNCHTQYQVYQDYLCPVYSAQHWGTIKYYKIYFLWILRFFFGQFWDICNIYFIKVEIIRSGISKSYNSIDSKEIMFFAYIPYYPIIFLFLQLCNTLARWIVVQCRPDWILCQVWSMKIWLNHVSVNQSPMSVQVV